MGLPRDVQKKLMEIKSMVIRDGPLDRKTKALIAVASAVTAYCTHCHGDISFMARKMGLSDEEIAEAEEIALRMRERCPNEYGLYRIGTFTADGFNKEMLQ